MKKFKPSFVTIAVLSTLYVSNSYASSCDESILKQCLINVPTYDKPLFEGDVNTLPIEIDADHFNITLPNQATYQGDVSIIQGNRSVKSEKVVLDSLDQTNRKITLTGNIEYQDNLVKMTGDSASMELNTNHIEIENSQFHLVGRLGRGTSDLISFKDNRYITLEDGSFTFCPIDNNSWNIEGSKIIHDNEEELLEVWNAIFRVGKVPVLYVPYLQLPTGDKRRSGLLIPQISYDSIEGFDVALPIYWNIAPNYDATFTPHFMQRRGLQLQTEMRYLNDLGLGTIAFDWLGHDTLYSKNRHDHSGTNYGNNKHRWLFYWKNEQTINDNWHFNVESIRVSDNKYLQDLNSQYASSTDGYLTQFYNLGYTNNNWDIALNYKYFQSLRDELKDNLYQTEPELSLNYYSNHWGAFSFQTYGQFSHFVSSGTNNPKTWRFHVEPSVNYTQLSPWGRLSTDVGFLATRYYQDIPDENLYPNLEKSVNRFIPKVSVDGTIIFERNIDFLSGYTQTIEPRIKYLYIPYRDQSSILNYDSSLLQSDYISLFRDMSYSGLDRIASSNKIAIGITSRFYDKNKNERFNFSIGQIYYFTHSKTGDINSPLDSNKDSGSITWSADTYWKVNDNFIFRSGMQYDTRINEISLASSILEYRLSKQKLVQLSYRYANKNYIDSIGVLTDTPYQQDISQFGIMSSWPITDNVTAIGSYYYDINVGQTIDSFIGLNYSDCCWNLGLLYGRKIVDWNTNTHQSSYENKFSINFELTGFGKANNTIAKMLDFGLLPYKTAFEEDKGTNP